MREFFRNLTGYLPYEYQIKVADRLFNERNNVFLCAPTGSGKTWSALLAYLWAKKQKIEFTDRLIYVLPLRTLATTLYAETTKCCKKIFAVKNFFDERTNAPDELIISIQTGEQKNDPFFESDIIFTTVDQCLSSYLFCPVSLPQKLANINAGALLGSLIVFDEFHLLEPDKAMTTAIEMIERLNTFSRFIIMSATLTTKSLESLKEIIDGELIQLSRDEVLSLSSHKEKERTYCWVSKPLNTGDILKYHNNKRSIVILNTVTKAQNIFKELRYRLKDTSTNLFLLHSRFYPEDRKKTEEKLKKWFGKNANKTNVILVTTQVVEAGVDISCDNLHTECAPLNSIVQRAGRCARYEGDRGIGMVWIYELETDEKGQIKLGPYRGEQAKLISETRTILNELPAEGKNLDFIDELQLIEKVHSKHEEKYLKEYSHNSYDLKNKINAAMDGNNETAIRDLIRDTASVNVIISNDPNALDFYKDKWPRMISVPRSSLYNLDFSDSDERVAWYPTEDSNIIDESELSFAWERISSKEQLKNISWLIVINPKFASYSEFLGLQIGVKGDYKEPEYLERRAMPRYKINYETYSQHIQKVVDECNTNNVFYSNAIKQLADYYKISVERLEEFMKLCCIFHDIGKLSTKWQEKARNWQNFKNPQKLTNEPIAHTDYDPEKDFEEKKKLVKQFPPHSSEGAYAIGRWLINYAGEDMVCVIWTAIVRHHGAFTESLSSFKLLHNASKYVFDGTCDLEDNPDNLNQNKFADDLLHFSKNNDDERLWALYAFLVRRLRLADQKSQIRGHNENSKNT
ncbi:MAG: CRISPR-associated helicase Cas3' [Candidatus Omnitrophota bacterium]